MHGRRSMLPGLQLNSISCHCASRPFSPSVVLYVPSITTSVRCLVTLSEKTEMTSHYLNHSKSTYWVSTLAMTVFQRPTVYILYMAHLDTICDLRSTSMPTSVHILPWLHMTWHLLHTCTMDVLCRSNAMYQLKNHKTLVVIICIHSSSRNEALYKMSTLI